MLHKGPGTNICPFSHQRGREATSDPMAHLPGARALLLPATSHQVFEALCVLVLAFLGWTGTLEDRGHVCFVFPVSGIGTGMEGLKM